MKEYKRGKFEKQHLANYKLVEVKDTKNKLLLYTFQKKVNNLYEGFMFALRSFLDPVDILDN